MIWPTLIVDNFLNDPIKVKEFALKQSYSPDKEGRWPGERSDYLHILNRNLFDSITVKIMSLMYPYEISYNNMQWNALCSFQKIKPQISNLGWAHHDAGNEFTAIIYLSSHLNCGTSVCEPKDFYNKNDMHTEKKKQMFLNNDKKMIPFQKEVNNCFTDTINISSRFNRLVLFDSSNYHRANQFEEKNITEDRLTLICFFTDIRNNKGNTLTPIPSSRRTIV
tara:strand:- start:491 stop:1156 length:666 start_codon:yes stop_codon:yes gene_type:complete